MNNRTPQAGDGIVDNDGNHWVVDGIATDSITGVFEGILYINEMGERTHLKPDEYRRETFFEYLTRPTGFGRTPWVAFALIQSMVIAMISAGVATIDQAGWVAFIIAAAIEAVLVGMSYRNYTGKTR
jgi:hypothetical protein